MIDAAIVGLGRHGRNLVAAVQGKSNSLRFTRAVVRRLPEAASFALQHGIALCSRLEDVLADSSIQAIVLATPHSQHPGQVIASAAAGKHVLCEKPLALALEEATGAVDACARAGVVLGVGHDKRFWPSMQALRRLVAGGELGEILHVEAHNSNEVSRGFANTWRESELESPAGGMTGTGIHSLDALISIAGPVRRVEARLATYGAESELRDSVSALLHFERGASGTMATVRSTPFYWRVHAFGTDGWAEALGRSELIARKKGREPVAQALEPVDALRAELDAFADAVAGLAPYPIPTGEMLATVAAFEGSIRSIRTGAGVTLNGPVPR